MYTGRALKSNIEWLAIRIRKARNRSRLGKSSIIFKSICWSSRALLTSGIAIVQFIHPENDMKILPELQCIEDILHKSDILFDTNRLKESKHILDEYTKISNNINNGLNTTKNTDDNDELQDNQQLPEIKWRQARVLYSLSKSTKDKNERNSLIYDAYKLIKSALSDNCTIINDKFSIHKWMAIILDAKVELDGVKSRILEICNIKKHMEYAVKLNQNDPSSWYFLGAYEFGLADLPWVHKKLISTITQTTVPKGSYEKALQHFQFAENLKPGFYSKNLLMLGKCSLALQKIQDAKKFLQKVTNFQVINREDQYCQKEAVELLRRIGTKTK